MFMIGELIGCVVVVGAMALMVIGIVLMLMDGPDNPNL